MITECPKIVHAFRQMSNSDDRRRRVRIPVQGKIRHSQYQVLGTPVFQENSSIDLSSGGISFETEREYQIGNLVLLEVEIGKEPLKLLVCVAWVKTARGTKVYQVGAELIAIDPVDKRKMYRHLNGMIDSLEKARKKPAKKVGKKKVVKKKASKKKTPAKSKKKA